MAKQIRSKKSTVSNLVAAAQIIREKPISPIDLDCDEVVVFEAVVRSRERDTWSDHDLREAGKLAKLQVQFEREWELLMSEGTVTINERGTAIENPRNRVCMTLQNTIKNLASSLGLTASQRGIAGAKQQIRNEQETKMQRTKSDDLLA